MRRFSSDRFARAACVVGVTSLSVLAACGQQYPNSTFNPTTDFNTDVYALWNRLLLLGTIVFIFVEGLLLFTVFKFRRREGAPARHRAEARPAAAELHSRLCSDSRRALARGSALCWPDRRRR